MTSPISSNQAQNNGRSSQADLIYQQYLDYYNDINNKINTINQLPTSQVNLPQVAQARTALVSLQQQLYPLYTSSYNNSAATLASFQSACTTIETAATQAYKSAVAGTNLQNSPMPSPLTVFASGNTSGSSSSSSGSTSSTTGSTTSTTGSTSSTTGSTTSTSGTTAVKSTGRSPDAAQIYSQYLTYYNDINTKITAINQLPASQLNQPNVAKDKAQLITLQQQLYPIYTSQYNSSSATLASFTSACASIESSVNAVFKDATSPATVPTVPTPTTPTVPTTPTTPTVPTTPTTPTTPITQASSAAGKVENGAWYVDWTSWNTPVPEGINTVNLFVGNMHLDASGKPVVDGFGTLSQNYAQMDTFIKSCHAKGITVKMSLGGGGGSYDNCWDVLTSNNVQGFAQALANFCNTHGADGIDFDCEEFTSGTDRPAQQALVGTLIKDFKAINPNYQTSLDTNAGFGVNFPWQGIVQNILNASLSTDPVTKKTSCGVDRVYIMSYYNSLSDEQGWVTGWANWLKTNYNFAPSQITVGLNSQSNAYDVSAFAAWAAKNGYSTSYWEYDPANPTQSNQSTNTILKAYNSNIAV